MRTLVTLLCLSLAGSLYSATYGPYSPTAQSTIQAAINNASDGDTVLVGPGSATWSTPLNVNKAVRVKGAGVQGTGTTVITQGGSVNTKVIACIGNGKYTEVSGFEFHDSWVNPQGYLQFMGNSWRLCSNTIYFQGEGVVVWDSANSGLIDRNVGYGTGGGMVTPYGDPDVSWSSGPNWGTTNCLYVEHNTITMTGAGDGVWDSYKGARMVWRYNIMTNCYGGWHGTDSGAGGPTDYSARSAHSHEIYGNQFWYNNGGYYCLFNSRGGTFLCFSNSTSGRTDGGAGVLIQYFRSTASYTPWGMMTGSNPFDGNTDGTGYPGIDQPGMTGPTTGYYLTRTGTSTTQAHSPMYIWNNTGTWTIGSGSYAQLGRDYFTTAAPGYTPLVDPHPLAGGVTLPATNPPTIQVQPQSVSIVTNTSATFTVSASGDGTLTYQWKLGGVNISGATSSSYITNNAPIAANGNVYSVAVTNAYGYAISSNATLTVTVGSPPPSATYYVAANGSDANSGSINSPWATLEYATAHMSAGNLLYVRGGNYTEVFDLYGPSGADTNHPTIVMAYPGETPVFNHGDQGSSGCSMNTLGNYVISGLTLSNYQTALYCFGISNTIITNMTFAYTGQEGFQMQQSCHDCLVVSNIVHDTGRYGVYGEGIYIGKSDTAPPDPTHDITIRSNLVYNTFGEGIEVKPGTYNIIVEGNTFHDCDLTQPPSGGAAIEVDADTSNNYYSGDKNQIIRNNRVYNTIVGIHLACSSLAYNNVIWNTSGDGIDIDSANGTDDGRTRRAFNNTVIKSPATAIVRTAGNYAILNNLGPNTAYNMPTNNAYFVNPSANNYHLVLGAAPIDAGTNLSGYYSSDADGNPRPVGSAFDIGAYEFAGAGSPIASLTPSSLNFGIRATNTATYMTIALTNAGSAGTTLSGTASVASPFTIVSNANYSLGSGQGQIIGVRYTPSGFAQDNGTMAFSGSANTAALTGIGYMVQPVNNMQASNATAISPMVVANGIGYATATDSGGLLIFGFNVTTNSSISFLANVQGPNNASNSFDVQMNGIPVEPQNVFDIAAAPGWQTVAVSQRGNGTDLAPQFPTNVWSALTGNNYLAVMGREAYTLITNIFISTQSAPIITVQPSNATVISGSQATFTVTATGTSPSYQWFKNGVSIPGANSAVYSTPPTTLSDNGATFYVNVVNSVGQVNSSTATLTVSGVPVVGTINATTATIGTLNVP